MKSTPRQDEMPIKNEADSSNSGHVGSGYHRCSNLRSDKPIKGKPTKGKSKNQSH
jgi:hypothetical protein